jgi:hypothetical protein
MDQSLGNKYPQVPHIMYDYYTKMLWFSTKARQVCFRTIEESRDKICADWIKVIDIVITGVLI